MFLCFLASLSKLITPPELLPPAGLPDRPRLCAQHAYPCQGLSRFSETDLQRSSFCLSGHQHWLWFVFPTFFPVLGRPPHIWVPFWLGKKEQEGGQRLKVGRQQPPAVALAFSWAGAVMACPEASPALCTMLSVKPCLLFAWPRSSASLSLLLKPWGLKAGIDCSLVSRKKEPGVCFPAFLAPLAICTWTGQRRRGLKPKGHLLPLHKRGLPRLLGNKCIDKKLPKSREKIACS